METCITLHKPFLLGIFQDICELYPEEISPQAIDGCLNVISLLKEIDVINICKIGKMIEKSFITGEKLPLSSFPHVFSSEALGNLFYDEDRIPRILQNCFERCFRRDGTPVWIETESISHSLLNEAEWQEPNVPVLEFVHRCLGTKLADSYATAMLSLRAFYVGCSKLRSWECLRRRNFGDTDFQTTRYTAIHAPVRDHIERTNRMQTSSEGTILFRRFRFMVAVS